MHPLAEKLKIQQKLERREWEQLLTGWNPADDAALFQEARNIREAVYGKKVYIRGLIEISSYCRNDCYYCGIRRSNRNAGRFRLTREEILNCAATGWQLGFRTFVLQGGEDFAHTAGWVADTVRELKAAYPECAVTLSLGERSEETYRLWREAGADRYLLRHETADEAHYQRLHPREQTLAHRKACLWSLKNLGYQVGTGMMVGSPGQTKGTLAEDLLFIQELRPQMVGIGPFLSHKDTPFAKETNGSLEWTLRLLALLRLMNPKALIPATTALATLAQDGRERGMLAGANVVMPNLSPDSAREQYQLYDNKKNTGAESGEGLRVLQKKMQEIGYEVVTDRGDFPG